MNVVHFLNPWAAWFALSIPAIIILYMLKMRRREIEVPSTLLWRQVLKDARANAPWQKLTRNLLLFLQILIALALVFALLRPSLMTAGTRGRNLVVLLDASASMQAVDVSPSRFDAAKKEVMALINEMGAGDTMTIIKMAALPEVVARATSDKSVLKKRLNEVTVTGEEANLAPALSLASSLVKGMEKPLTVIVSDGNLGKIPPHTPLPPEIVHIKVGKADDNLTLTPPATRREGNATVTMVRVVNNGSKDVVTTVELWVDGKLFDARAVALKAGEGKNLYWTDIPEDARLLMARSTYPDMLP
ncbi:vWA domain-containing protein, partial [Calderihabitans maritimus]